jgi:hypothetical protein
MITLNGSNRSISAGHDWPLYGDEYGRMKFGNYQKQLSTVSDNRPSLRQKQTLIAGNTH